MQEDFSEVIDGTKLQKLNFSQELKMAFLEKPLAVQILHAINVGAPKKDQEEDGDEKAEQEEEEDKKFENKYLDPKLK